jgi:hypothetical protein
MPKSIASNAVQSLNETGTGLCTSGTMDSTNLGSAIPTTASLFAPGCKIIDLSTGVTYTNTGTTAVPVWGYEVSSFNNDPQSVKLVVTPITAAGMIDTAAGALSHANGLTIVPAAPTGYVNVFHRAIVSYTFATAAYTGGGNTTINIGGGGAALSGLIATTTLWQNASSIIQMFVPLSTVAFPITKETALSLKTASAITNPGTAAGTARVYCWYSTVAI